MRLKVPTYISMALALVLSGCVADQIANDISATIDQALGKEAPSETGTVYTPAPVSTDNLGSNSLPSLSNVEACDHPDSMRAYLSSLRSANPLMMGWGGLFGGVNKAQQHCSKYQSVTPLNADCVAIGYGYEACPAMTGDVLVWTWGRDGLSTGLN